MCTNSVCNTKNSQIHAGTSHLCGSNVWIATPFRSFPDAPNEYGGRGIHVDCDLSGIEFSSEEAANQAMQEHGYTTDYTRNCVDLKISPKMREEDFWCDDIFFVSKVIRNAVNGNFPIKWDDIPGKVERIGGSFKFTSDEGNSWEFNLSQCQTNGKALSYLDSPRKKTIEVPPPDMLTFGAVLKNKNERNSYDN